LKKYQVFIPEWLDDYMKRAAFKYDVSISEMLRIELCFAALCTITTLYPEYKADFSIKEIIEKAKEYGKAELEREEFHRLLSLLYFETRKAIEYRYKKEKSRKK